MLTIKFDRSRTENYLFLHDEDHAAISILSFQFFLSHGSFLGVLRL